MEFEQLAEQMKPKMEMLLNQLKIYKNREEYYQIAFISLWQASLSYVPGKYDVTAYLYNQMRFDVIDALRKNSKIEERYVPIEEQELARHLVAIDKAFVSSLILEELLDRLSKEEKVLVHMMFFEERSNQQIAQHLQLSVESVRKRKYRLRQKLKYLGQPHM